MRRKTAFPPVLVAIFTAVLLAAAPCSVFGETLTDYMYIAGGDGKTSVVEKGDEMMFGDARWDGQRDLFEKKRKDSSPGLVTELKVPAGAEKKGRKLEVEAAYCGVVLEPSGDGMYAFELVGVKKGHRDKISAKLRLTEDGTLRLTAMGSASLGYINLSEDFRVNTVVLKVPDTALLEKAKFSVSCGLLTSFDLAQSTQGDIEEGLIRIGDKSVEGNYEIGADSGNVKFEGERIAGKVKVTSQNATVKITGGQVAGPVSVSTDNGSVTLSVTGELGRTDIQAKNGDISLGAGVLTGDVTAMSGNGEIFVALGENPRNLSLKLKKGNGEVTLPKGWTDKSVFGSGKPTLSLESGNGETELSVPAR